MSDALIEELIVEEEKRQDEGIELIASENYPSKDVRAVQGSILTAKYAEGYPGRRYYGGCEVVDEVERAAIDRAKELFGAAYANVQPHSGSQANFAAYHALLPKGGKVLSLDLNDGGHLTHGSPVSFSSHLYAFVHYGLGKDGRLDYEEIARRLEEEDPDILLSGYSAYPYVIDFEKLREIVDAYEKRHEGKKVYLMVDMAHIAGLVAAGLHPSPVPYADVVTSTTHKTLRGPRGGLILSRDASLAKRLDSAVFPYTQGGPLLHVIGAKAVAFKEALKPEFKDHAKKVIENTKAARDVLYERKALVSDTENHLFLLNVYQTYGIDGKTAQKRLEEIGITTNKNMLHGDTLPPALCSGLRLGFAAATSRGCTKEEAREIAALIDECLRGGDLELLRKKALQIAAGWRKISDLSY